MSRTNLRVVFDLDDTLYAERDFAISGFHAASTWAQARFGTPDIASEMTELLDSGHLGKLFQLSLGKHAPGHSEDDLSAFIDEYRSHLPALQMFPDAVGALEHAAQFGPLGLITDGTEWVQRNKVKALGIEPRFTHLIYTSSLGGRAFHKPHPRAYELMEAALGHHNAHFVYVGDNPAKDFVVPNARGWTTVQVVRPSGIHDHTAIAPGGEPGHQIDDLSQLAALIEGL